MKTTGEKIRDLRRQKGHSQEELSFNIGVSRQTISKWEADTMQPTMDNIRALCDYFNVNPDFFLNDGDKNNENNLSAATQAEVMTESKQLLPKRFIVLYSLLAALSTAICVLCLVIGGIAISINNQPSLGYTEVHAVKVDWLSIVCFIVAFCALVALITFLILIFKRRKRKM